MHRVLLGCVFAVCVFGETPLIYNRGVVNAASLVPQGVPGGAIAQGSLFVIYGANLGPAEAANATAFPLSTTFAGTSITISQGNATVNAFPYYVSSGRVNAIMPSSAPLGWSSLRITTSAGKSNAVPVLIAANAFGIFSANGSGNGPGVFLQNSIAAGTPPINAPTTAAQPGQTAMLFGTGLGPVQGGDNVAPPVGNLHGATVEVFVGGQAATVLYSGRAPGFAGTDQINFVVPRNAPAGCWVPVYVRTNGSSISNFVTMAIGAADFACSDAANPLAQVLASGGNTGAVAAVHATTHEDIGTAAPVDVATDFAVSGFSNLAGALFAFHPALSLPPPGTCTQYTGKADLLNADFVGLSVPPAGALLNAGAPAVLAGPSGSVTLTPNLGVQSAIIGSTAGAMKLGGNLSLTPGDYTVSGGGGTDVGTFSAKLTVPQPVAWTNRDQFGAVSRSQPLTISWTGGSPGDVVGVVGLALDLPSNSGAAFACVAQPGASSITVPADVLANLPPAEQNLGNSTDVIYLVSVPQSATAPIAASGLNSGVALFAYVNGKTVIFQ